MATSIRSIKSLVPLLDRVLVQRVKAEAKTASGIFLPESSVKELNEAKVLAVGPGALSKDGTRVPMGVQQGDRVLIPQNPGQDQRISDSFEPQQRTSPNRQHNEFTRTSSYHTMYHNLDSVQQ
ncbi:GroES-like protein [Xylariaceae sp. FL0594]|nr:GroES-like protein [Xylariaceae sp. FL0594]